MKVSLVRWPAESERREALRRSGEPRLLLVEQGAPPVPADHREDWIRLPADDVDLRARLQALRRRLGAEIVGTPRIDEDGVMRVDDRWVALPPVEARLAGLLVGRFGALVSREALTRAGWPAGSSSRNALDVHVFRLRRRLAPLGLAIRTVRSRGYVLERDDGGGQVLIGSEPRANGRTLS